MTTKTKEPPVKDEVDPKTGELRGGLAPGGEKAGTEVTTGDEYDYGADAGAGRENQDSSDVSIPFLSVLQPGSPEVGEDPEKPPFPGYLINKTTGEWVPPAKGVTFIPAYTQHQVIEWKPRDEGGGVVARHEMGAEIVKRAQAEQKFGTWKNPDGLAAAGNDPDAIKKVNDLVETYYVYGVQLTDEGDPIPAVMSFSSTHIKAYQDWNFRMRSLVIPLPNGKKLTAAGMPLWAVAWRVSSKKHPKSTKDHTWYVPEFSFAGATAVESLVKPNSLVYQFAKSLKEAVATGEKVADEGALARERNATQHDAALHRGDTDAEKAPY